MVRRAGRAGRGPCAPRGDRRGNRRARRTAHDLRSGGNRAGWRVRLDRRRWLAPAGARYVRREDEPVARPDGDSAEGDGTDTVHAPASGQDGEDDRGAPVSNVVPISAATDDDDDADDDIVKPLPDRLVADLTAWRTLALQDAFAQSPSTALRGGAARLRAQHLLYGEPRILPSGVAQRGVLRLGTGVAAGTAARPSRSPSVTRAGRSVSPGPENDLWEALLQLDGAEQAALYAHCASKAVNAQAEIVPKHDNGRISKHKRRAAPRTQPRPRARGRARYRRRGLEADGGGLFPQRHQAAHPRRCGRGQGAEVRRDDRPSEEGRHGARSRATPRRCRWLPEPMRTPELLDLLAADPAAGVEGGELPASSTMSRSRVWTATRLSLSPPSGPDGGAVSAVPPSPSIPFPVGVFRAGRFS